MEWKATADRVLVKRTPSDGNIKKMGGIIVPDRISALVTGVVQAAGPDARGVLPGDVAIFNPKNSLTVENLPDGDIVSLNADFILALQRSE